VCLANPKYGKYAGKKCKYRKRRNTVSTVTPKIRERRRSRFPEHEKHPIQTSRSPYATSHVEHASIRGQLCTYDAYIAWGGTVVGNQKARRRGEKSYYPLPRVLIRPRQSPRTESTWPRRPAGRARVCNACKLYHTRLPERFSRDRSRFPINGFTYARARNDSSSPFTFSAAAATPPSSVSRISNDFEIIREEVSESKCDYAFDVQPVECPYTCDDGPANHVFSPRRTILYETLDRWFPLPLVFIR